MKKLLSLIGTFALTTVTITPIIACSGKESNQKINLSTIIEIRDLGAITFDSTPTKTKVLADIKAKNPTANNLTENDFAIKTIDIPLAAITITGIENYEGEVTLKYAKQTVKIDLNDIIQDKDLGAITFDSAPTKTKVLADIKAKNPTASNLTENDFAIKTIDIPLAAITITGIGNYEGDVILKYAKQTAKIDLNILIQDKDLGVITIFSTIPTKSELLTSIKAKNPITASTLTENDFAIKKNDPTTLEVIITGIGNYEGDITLTYSKSALPNLNDVIKSKNLDEIYLLQPKKTPAVNKIKSEIKKKNPGLDINGISILNSDITTTTAKVTGDNIKYTGFVTVDFKINNFTAMKGTSGFIKGLAVDSVGNVYAGDIVKNGVYKSNGTDDFKPINGTSGGITSITVAPNGNVYAGGNNVYKSDGTNSFEPMNGISGLILALISDKFGNIYAGSERGGVYKSNGTDDFKPINGTSDRINALATDLAGNIYAGSDDGNVYKCNVGDKHFTSTVTGTSGKITALAADEIGNIYAGSETGIIYKCTDGIHFNQIGQINGNVLSLTVNKRTIYAGTNAGSGKLYKSTNGTTFNEILTNIGTILSLTSNKDNIYVGTNKNIVYNLKN